jgi:hypothetical protein
LVGSQSRDATRREERFGKRRGGGNGSRDRMERLEDKKREYSEKRRDMHLLLNKMKEDLAEFQEKLMRIKLENAMLMVEMSLGLEAPGSRVDIEKELEAIATSSASVTPSSGR